TGSPTASSPATTTSSITAAMPGTSWSRSPGPSCPSVCATGHAGSDQRVLVLGAWDEFPRFQQATSQPTSTASLIAADHPGRPRRRRNVQSNLAQQADGPEEGSVADV